MTDDVSLLPMLIVEGGPMRGVSFRLGGANCVIGRDDGVDILVEDVQVSRRHATIEPKGSRLMLTDAGSTNGTWLNDRQVTEAAELSDGDLIRVGGVELRFYDPNTASTEPMGARIRAVLQPRAKTDTPAGAGVPRDALLGPTQVMDTARRSRTPWLVLATVVLLLVVTAAVWAFLIR